MLHMLHIPLGIYKIGLTSGFLKQSNVTATDNEKDMNICILLTEKSLQQRANIVTQM